ncbi:MAG: S8 family serine peptidase [Candidatus Cybelea sp.]
MIQMQNNRASVRVLSLLAILALGACSSGATAPSLLPNATSPGLPVADDGDAPFQSVDPVRNLCSAPATDDRARCFAMVRTDVAAGATPMLATAGVQPAEEVQNCRDLFSKGYCPIDLQTAYGLPSLTNGFEKVVAIVDAYGYHHAAADLAQYRKTMGLKPCTTESKCLRIVNQSGQSSPLPPEPPLSDDWKGEQSLDLDMVSAICPHCKIILVQSKDDYTNDLYAGVATAGKLGAKYVGASWGVKEFGGDDGTFHQAGVVIAAAAGDEGGGGSKGGPQQPCTYTYVVCVGGTHLVRSNNKRGWTETAWNDWSYDACGGPCGATGSGCSTKIAKPSWQTDGLCGKRVEADISASASLRSPVVVYNSEEGGGPCPNNCFWLYGGTSASAQIIAAAYALAGDAGTQSGASYLWKHHMGHVYDVLAGNNIAPKLGINCASSVKYICYARTGFDGPTGWGSPHGLGAL